MVVVFDECHELFEHRDYGAEAGGLAVRVVKKARKCGITCLFLTQSPTARSIPRDLTRNCTGGVAFAVADQVANDGLLGSGAYRQGIRATELRPGDDRGTAVTVGLTANRFELVNTFYVPFDEDDDQVTPVIARAMALLAERGLPMRSSTDPVDGRHRPITSSTSTPCYRESRVCARRSFSPASPNTTRPSTSAGRSSAIPRYSLKPG